jgi:hypothetical protein
VQRFFIAAPYVSKATLNDILYEEKTNETETCQGKRRLIRLKKYGTLSFPAMLIKMK